MFLPHWTDKTKTYPDLCSINDFLQDMYTIYDRARESAKFLTLFALWGVTFFTMTPNVTQSISSRFSAASLLFSWESRMSLRLAIFLSISAEDTRGFLDQVKACKREQVCWHKWTEAIKSIQHSPEETTSCWQMLLCLISSWGHLKQTPLVQDTVQISENYWSHWVLSK